MASKCRAGCTALTNFFGIAEFPTYCQPVEKVMRFGALGQPSAPAHRRRRMMLDEPRPTLPQGRQPSGSRPQASDA